MDHVFQHFIYNWRNLAPILRDQQELGAHTDVVEYRLENISTFRWTHHGVRPMGSETVNQCFACHRLKTLKPKVNENVTQVVLKCSQCNYAAEYNFPDGWSWVNGIPAKGDERGAWIVRVEPAEGEVQMDVT